MLARKNAAWLIAAVLLVTSGGLGTLAWLRGGLPADSRLVLRSISDLNALRSLLRDIKSRTTLSGHLEKQSLLDISTFEGKNPDTHNFVFALGPKHTYTSRSYLLKFLSTPNGQHKQTEGHFQPRTIAGHRRPPAIIDVMGLDVFRAFIESSGYELIKRCLAKHSILSLRLRAKHELQETPRLQVFELRLFTSHEEIDGPQIHVLLWYTSNPSAIEAIEILQQAS